jgi:hypothetical protein
MRRRTFTATALAGGLLAAPRAFAQNPAAPRPTAPLFVLSGRDTKCDRTGFLRLRDATAWNALWAAHQGLPAEESFHAEKTFADVDFTHVEVLALLPGAITNTRALQVLAVLDEPDRRVVRFDGLTFQTFGKAVAVRPYAFVLLARDDRPLIVEENVQNLKNEPARWTARAELPAG